MARQANSSITPGALRRAPGASADAVLVFGAEALASGPSAELSARLAHASMLWQRGDAPVIAVSGGVDGDVCETSVMCEWLRDNGVPTDAIVRIEPGGTTRETIRSARAAGDLAYIAVSSPYHARRIRAEARRMRVRMTTDCPATTPECASGNVRRVRVATEMIARAWYALPPSVTDRLHSPLAPLRHAIPGALIALLGRGR